MSVFAGLLLREWLEHRGAFLWAAGIVLGLILLAAISSVAFSTDTDFGVSGSDREALEERLGEDIEERGGLSSLAALALDVAGSTDEELTIKLEAFQRGIGSPFAITFSIVAFFVLIGVIYDERKDRSVLFWKSMPVSDTQSVLSKLIFVLWVAPLVSVVAAFLAQFCAVTLSSIYVESGMGGRVWANSGIWMRPFGLVAQYLMFSLWALPIAGWLLLVSSFVSRAPVLVALGGPLLFTIVERILFNQSVLSTVVGAHFTMLGGDSDNPERSTGVFSILAEPGLWVGILVGCGFVAAAIYFRKRNNDI